MIKFGRNYRLEIQAIDGTTQTIAFPLTCDFNVVRNTMSSAQSANFTIFNLSETTRNLIRKNAVDVFDQRVIKFYAGYGDDPDQLPLVFQGQVLSCTSTRESVDWMTDITCQDPGFPILGDVSYSVGAGTPYNQVVKNIIGTFMPGVSLGAIGGIFDDQPSLLKGNSFSGSVQTILSQLTGGNHAGANLYFENQKAYILQDFECLPSGGIDTLDSSTGLIGSPYYEETFIHAKLIFEPRILLGQEIDLESETQLWLNGTKKVTGYSHRGTISGAVGGDATTEITLYAPLNSQGLQVLGIDQVFQ